MNESFSELTVTGNSVPILVNEISMMNERCLINHMSNIELILNNQEYMNKKIIVVSIIGVVRTGKSFLLNYILRHVILKLADSTQMHVELPLEGFYWYYGLDMITKGLQLWSQPYIVKFGKEEAIVLFLDAQGIFGKMHSMNEDVRIGAASLFLSSLLIVNVHKQIDENICSYLHLITNFTKINLKITYFRKPFQNLVFVVRDWQNSSAYPFGCEGGMQYLRDISKRSRFTNGPLLDLNYFESMYDNICCCLLPHPGEKAMFNKMFDGRLYDLEGSFVENLRKFLNHIFSGEFIEFKSINDGYLSCKDLIQYASVFSSCINDHAFGDCDNIFIENAYVKMWENIESISNFYVSNMDKFFIQNDNMNNALLLEEHNRLEKNAKETWFNGVAIGKNLIKTEMLNIIDNRLNSLLKRYQNDNKYDNLHMGLQTPFALLTLSMLTYLAHQCFYFFTNFDYITYVTLNAWFFSVMLISIWLVAILWEIDELTGIVDKIANILIKLIFRPLIILLNSKETKAFQSFFKDYKVPL